MGTAFKVKPTHKPVKSYYAALEAYADQRVEHEGALPLVPGRRDPPACRAITLED